MLAKLIVNNGVARFPGLDRQNGFNCAFSTLGAGNMSANWGPTQKAEKNARQFYRRGGFSQDRVHLIPEGETNIFRVGKKDRGHVIRGDGLVTTVPKLTLSLYPADCLPIVITKIPQGNQQSEFVSLIHAGWSGTDQRILEKAIRFIKETLGLPPNQLLVLIGPGIHVCCYRLSSNLIFSLSKRSRWERWKPFIHRDLIDLVGYNLQQAQAMGIQRQNIIVADDCTSCAKSQDDYRFFSHRRSKKTGEKEGRFAAAVSLL